MTTFLLSLYKSKYIWQGTLGAAVLLAAAHIIQVNLLTDMAYALSAQERELAELGASTKQLEAKYAAQISFDGFEGMAQTLGFEKVGRMTYVEVRVPRVAQTEE